MKFKKENIEIQIDIQTGELESIKVDNIEILYQGTQSWKKTFPILFPAVGVAKNWRVDGKNIELPKHGYWRELKWEIFQEDHDLLLTSICVSKLLPYIFDISLRISISISKVTLTACITNASMKNAYFHFGWHPAYNIDDNAKILINKNEKAMVINNDGIIEKEHLIDIDGKIINKLPFNKNIDSLIMLDTRITNVKIINKKYMLDLYFSEPNLVIWKKPSDDFICIEPYHGYSDLFDKNYISEIELKPNIIKLPNSETFTSMYVIDFCKNNDKKS